MSENKDKLDATAAGDIETAISEAKTALGGEDVDAMNNAFEKLQTASHKLAEVLYSQTAAQTEGGESAAEEQASSASAGADGEGAAAADDNVIDAEYVDVEEEKK
jgi:molecular chaperone DnaK